MINSIEVLDEAVRLYGAPEIINSDQGCQYTSKDWTEACEKYGITMSMDGRGRAKDNIWIPLCKCIKSAYQLPIFYSTPEFQTGGARF